jgi:hypothetical protein
MEMSYFPRRQRVGVVGRVGADRCGLLRRRLGIGAAGRIGLIYPGSFGIGNMSWKGLERFAQWRFVGLYPLPGDARNYHILAKAEFPYGDLAASSDLVVSKIGYATVAECMLNGTPLLYLPRADFAEYAVLKRGVDDWGFGHCLDAGDYRALRWDAVLARVPLRGAVPRVPANGAGECARALEELAAGGR